MIIAVDFDGTLANVIEFPDKLSPNLELFQMVKRWKKWGHKIILWTCREGKELEIAINFCTAQGLLFDAVNDNIKRYYGNNSRKIYADVYIDDRNAVDLNQLHRQLKE